MRGYGLIAQEDRPREEIGAVNRIEQNSDIGTHLLFWAE
jgi:hypothetical protein